MRSSKLSLYRPEGRRPIYPTISRKNGRRKNEGFPKRCAVWGGKGNCEPCDDEHQHSERQYPTKRRKEEKEDIPPFQWRFPSSMRSLSLLPLLQTTGRTYIRQIEAKVDLPAPPRQLQNASYSARLVIMLTLGFLFVFISRFNMTLMTSPALIVVCSLCLM